MAITNPNASDQLDAALANGRQFAVSKASQTAKGAGNFHSLWKSAGLPSAGLNPTVGAGNVPTRQTVGAVPLPVFGANTGYLAKLSLATSTVGTYFLGDRLYANSGLNGNIATLQVINGPSITRNLTTPNLLFLEFYTSTGATAANITVNYTNLANQAKSFTQSFQTSPATNQLTPVLIPDTGVLSIQSAQLSVPTGTVGDFGFTIINQIDTFSLPLANTGIRLGVYDLALPVIDPESCLFFYQLCSSVNAGPIYGNMSIAVG